MADDKDALEERLREVETDLDALRRDVRDVRERIGDRSDDPTDPEERAALLTSIGEQEALLTRMEERRTELLHRLGRG